MTREVIDVCNYLKSKSILIPADNEWISSCVECFKEHGNYSMRELNELVYQQWLLADLADIGVQVIPNSLFSTEKCILEGRYAVQLNYLVNVAISFHKQLQKIRRPDVLKNLEVDSDAPFGNVKKEESGPRMLKIEFTDGVVTFVGFEDQFIPSLKEPFVPGMKAILVGPIECRKGVAFLKQRNVVVLGGEVESLHVPNATENVLARALKLPENPDPYALNSNPQTLPPPPGNSMEEDNFFDDDDEAMIMLAEAIEKSPEIKMVTSTPASNLGKNASSSSNVNTNISWPYSQASTVPAVSQARATPTSSSNPQLKPKQNVFSVSDTDHIDFDEDFDTIASSVVVLEKDQSKSNANIDSAASELKTYEIFDSTCAKRDFKEISDLKKKLNESYVQHSSNFPNNDSQSLTYTEDGRIVVDYLNDKVSPLLKLPIEPDPIPVISPNNDLPSIEPFPPKKRPATVTVFARVLKMVRKPKLINDKWSVCAEIEAKSITLKEVTFESDVIDKIFTVSAKEIVMKREELTKDPLKKKEMNEALKESHSRFNKLACDMTFHFKDAISDPVVIDVMINR